MDDTIWTTPNHFPGNSSLPTEQPFVEVTTSSVHDKALEDGKGNGSPMNNSRSSAGAGAEVSYENKVHDLSVRGASTKSSFLSDDETLNEGTTSRQSNRIDIKDWSQTGRGSHVDFKHEETVPLEQGEFVHEVKVEILLTTLFKVVGSAGGPRETCMKLPCKGGSLPTKKLLSNASLLTRKNERSRF